VGLTSHFGFLTPGINYGTGLEQKLPSHTHAILSVMGFAHRRPDAEDGNSGGHGFRGFAVLHALGLEPRDVATARTSVTAPAMRFFVDGRAGREPVHSFQSFGGEARQGFRFRIVEW